MFWNFPCSLKLKAQSSLTQLPALASTFKEAKAERVRLVALPGIHSDSRESEKVQQQIFTNMVTV